MIDQYIKFLEQSYDLNFDLVVQSQILETDIIPSDNNRKYTRACPIKPVHLMSNGAKIQNIPSETISSMLTSFLTVLLRIQITGIISKK